MYPFQLTHPQQRETAIVTASAKDAKYITGGTNLVDLMKLDIERPKQLVDINALALKQIETLANGNLLVGALVTNTELAYHESIVKQFPVISQAILSGASAQLRNMATVGGNILQRTRCPYFYDIAFACNKNKPQSGCSAIKGHNRNHAILGTSEHCIATNPSDFGVALAAMNTIVHVQGAGGSKRKIAFREFHLLPGNTPHIETVLKQGDLITHIEIPALSFAHRSHYLKVRDRASYEFALTSAAVALDLKDGIINDARIALGGIATKPWHAAGAENILRGQRPNEETYGRAAEAALKDAKGFQHNAFKIELAKRTLVRALTTTAAIV